MLVPTGGSLVSVPKYLLAFWGASWLFGPVPPFFASSWREIFDAVLADYACADCRLYCTKMAVFPKMLLRAEIQIVNFAGYISVRIRSKAIANGSGLAFNIRISSFRLKNAFMPGYCATSPRPRKVRSAPFPPAAKTLPAPFPAPLPTVRGTARPLVWSWATRNSKAALSGGFALFFRCLLQIEERLHTGILCHVASSPQSPLCAVSACGENSVRSLSGSSPHRAGHGGAPWYGAGRREKSRTAEAVLPAFPEVLTSN